MKKLLTIFLLLSLIFVSFAQDKVYPQIGKYKNVKVTGITWKGIRIQPEGGRSFYITDKDLSEADQVLLQEELKIWREKAARHGKRRSTERDIEQAKQEEELRGYLQKIPGFSEKKIHEWAEQLTGAPFDTPKFYTEFQKKFDYATNRDQVISAAKSRLTSLQNRFLERAIGEFGEMNYTKLTQWAKDHAGVDFSKDSFTERLQRRYRYATICERVKTAMMDRDLVLIQGAWKYLSDVAYTKSVPEINKILQETLELTISSANFRSDLFKIFDRIDQNEVEKLYNYLVDKEKKWQIAEQQRREEEARRRAEEEERRKAEERRRIEERNRRFAKYDRMSQQELREEINDFINSWLSDMRMKVNTGSYWRYSNLAEVFFDVRSWEIYGVPGQYSSRYNTVRVMVNSSNKGGSAISVTWKVSISRNEDSMRWEIMSITK